MSYRNILLFTLIFGLLFSVHAHKTLRSFNNNNKRNVYHAMRAAFATNPSTCSYQTCAVRGGNCALEGASLTFCPSDQYCDGSLCRDKLASGQAAACSLTSADNQCSNGESCIDANDGRGAVCQIYRSILPGNPCTADSQCFFSDYANGTSPRASTCSNGVCAGNAVGTACVGSHQCVSGSFCSSTTSTCTALGQQGASCVDNSQCDSSLLCFNSVCSRPYTQSNNQQCQVTENCAPGLYCGQGLTCRPASTVGNTNQACDIQGNDCGADQFCECNNFTSQGSSATCHGISGTPADMDTIYKNAYTCLANNKCGTDANNTANVACISNNCLASYCTYMTRAVPDLFDNYPSCLVARMVSNTDYNTLLQKCQSYKPGAAAPSTGAGSVLSASFASVIFVALATFFLAF